MRYYYKFFNNLKLYNSQDHGATLKDMEDYIKKMLKDLNCSDPYDHWTLANIGLQKEPIFIVRAIKHDTVGRDLVLAFIVPEISNCKDYSDLDEKSEPKLKEVLFFKIFIKYGDLVNQSLKDCINKQEEQKMQTTNIEIHELVDKIKEYEKEEEEHTPEKFENYIQNCCIWFNMNNNYNNATYRKGEKLYEISIGNDTVAYVGLQTNVLSTKSGETVYFYPLIYKIVSM